MRALLLNPSRHSGVLRFCVKQPQRRDDRSVGCMVGPACARRCIGRSTVFSRRRASASSRVVDPCIRSGAFGDEHRRRAARRCAARHCRGRSTSVHAFDCALPRCRRSPRDGMTSASSRDLSPDRMSSIWANRTLPARRRARRQREDRRAPSRVTADVCAPLRPWWWKPTASRARPSTTILFPARIWVSPANHFNLSAIMVPPPSPTDGTTVNGRGRCRTPRRTRSVILFSSATGFPSARRPISSGIWPAPPPVALLMRTCCAVVASSSPNWSAGSRTAWADVRGTASRFFFPIAARGTAPRSTRRKRNDHPPRESRKERTNIDRGRVGGDRRRGGLTMFVDGASWQRRRSTALIAANMGARLASLDGVPLSLAA